MISTAVDAQGTEWEVENASNAFIAIANVRGFSDLDGGESSEPDVTHLLSEAKEYRVGLRDSGTFTLDVDWNDADPGHQRLAELRASRAVEQFRCTFSDGYVLTFDGLVKRIPRSGAVDDVNRTQVTIRITGAVTVTEPA